jgi:predicted nucleotidyltransferase
MRAQSDSPVKLPLNRVAAFCRKWGIVELAVFGSILRDDFGPDSDIDFLARFSPSARPGLFALVDMQDELAAIVERRVDLLDRAGVERCENFLRRRQILDSAEVIDHDG